MQGTILRGNPRPSRPAERPARAAWERDGGPSYRIPQETVNRQRWLRSHPLPEIPGLEIAASCRPLGRACGDLYDFFPLDHAAPSQRWCVLLADASGHGLAAAVMMRMVQAIL